jgi:GWxTD domain-containing protein
MRLIERLSLIFLLLSYLSGCSFLRPKSKLDPVSAEFLSTVRFIITSEEKKTFLRLPEEERPAFIEAFWKKRDPDPETEINEYKEQFYERIKEANFLFKEGTTPGWLQDRGRVYILLGPPDQREVYPRGDNLYGPPKEIWWYGFFPIVFIDQNWSGNYTLDPQSAYQVAAINKAQMDLKPAWRKETPPEEVGKVEVKSIEGKMLIEFSIPYRQFAFELRANKLVDDLELSWQIRNEKGEIIWRERETEEVSLGENEREKLREGSFFKQKQVALEPGNYLLEVSVREKRGKVLILRKIPWHMRPGF